MKIEEINNRKEQLFGLHNPETRSKMEVGFDKGIEFAKNSMTAKQLLNEMIQERKDQIKHCEDAMDNYSDDRDQVEAFRRKKENNEFMLEVLKRKVIENSPAL